MPPAIRVSTKGDTDLPRRPAFDLNSGSDAVEELHGAVLGHGDLVLQRVGLDLLVTVGGVEDLPVARDGLDDRHRLLLRSVVAERDLPLDLVQIARDLSPVLLGPLADDLEDLCPVRPKFPPFPCHHAR
jgi:hypothetical protein